MNVAFAVNGGQVEVQVEPRTTLADCLRYDLRLPAPMSAAPMASAVRAL